MMDYSTNRNEITKVLDFVQLGGPGWTRTNDLGPTRTAADSIRFLRSPGLAISQTSTVRPTLSRAPLPNTEWSLSLHDYAAKGYGNRRSRMIIVSLRCPPL